LLFLTSDLLWEITIQESSIIASTILFNPNEDHGVATSFLKFNQSLHNSISTARKHGSCSLKNLIIDSENLLVAGRIAMYHFSTRSL
jgi:hypothetical protein